MIVPVAKTSNAPLVVAADQRVIFQRMGMGFMKPP
jgi:hypothetical protein